MKRTRYRPTSTTAAATSGFTLVELITAASLMTVMMLGVVEIFGIVTETAAEAEAQNFAHQQMRPFFDTLNRDLRGLTHDGYFYINLRRCSYNTTSSQWQFTTRSPGEQDYAFFSLAFVSIGQWGGTWDTDQNANAAELVYTNSVLTPTQQLEVSNRDVGVRRALLGGVWLLNGENPSSSGEDADHWSNSQCYLANLLVSANLRRVAGAWTDLTIWPWIAGDKAVSGGTTHNLLSLKRVMSSCTSEFFVERWNPVGNGSWSRANLSAGPTGNQSSFWPTALRVTVVVHDPSSEEPLPEGQKRFQGYALQEVFFLGDR